MVHLAWIEISIDRHLLSRPLGGVSLAPPTSAVFIALKSLASDLFQFVWVCVNIKLLLLDEFVHNEFLTQGLVVLFAVYIISSSSY
jgi:hypothetical protein